MPALAWRRSHCRTKLKQLLKLKHHDLKLVRDRVQVLHVLVFVDAVDDLISRLLVDALLHKLFGTT